MSKLPVNPFGENIVGEPRRIEAPVTGLNDDALEKLTNAFEVLTESSLPRVNRQAPRAPLVTSMEPGYGKSHLLGRLFRKLEHRATLIYVRPFQDPSSRWRSLLDRMVMELGYPDRADAVACGPGELSQLDVFARHVLAFLLVPLVERNEIKARDKAKTIAYLKEQPNEVFQNPQRVDWLKKNFQTLLGRLGPVLQQLGVHLHGGGTAWLKILLAYACEPASSLLRNACLDWIKYQPLEEEEAKQLSLRRAELPDFDLPHDQRNDKCSERIFDLLKLASFYRPFVLCFDQTELYENLPDLAKVLGQLIRNLGTVGENVLIVVTANKQVWESKISANFEHADKHFIAPPIFMQGINRVQAQELASNRLRTWRVNDNEIQAFLDANWLDKLFEMKREMSARGFINEGFQRWEGGTEPRPPADLTEVYRTYRAKLLHAPKSLMYDAGVLQWVFQEVFEGEAGLKIERFKSTKGYLSLRWVRDGMRVYFGFEEGDHFKRWEAILNEAKRYYSHDQRNHITSRSAFFRVHGQKLIPGQNWKIRPEFEAARHALATFHLDQKEVASLYAAHDLYADVAQGNQPFTKEETRRFLVKELHGWIGRIISGSRPTVLAHDEPKKLPPELIDTLRSLVSTNPYLSLNMLQKKLAERGLEADREQIFKTVEMIPEIKVFSTPTNAVFKWN